MTYKEEINDTTVIVHAPSRLDKLLKVGVPKRQYKKLIKEIDKELAGKSGAEEALKFANKKNIKIVERKLPEHSGGFYRKDGKTIIVNKDMPEGEKFWTVTHELDHLEHKDHLKDPRSLSKLNETKRERATRIKVQGWLKKNSMVGVAM